MKIIRKIMSFGILIILIFNIKVPANAGNDTANLLPETKISSVQFDLDQMIAYVFSETTGFVVFDINNPKDPVRIAHLDLKMNETVTSMHIHGSVIYITAGNSLHVIDVSDPYHPSTSYYTDVETEDGIAGFVIDGTRAYLFDRCNIHVFSLEHPALPGLLKSYEINDPNSSAGISGIAVHDGIIYAALGDDGIHIYDFSDLNDISYAGKFDDVQGSCKNIVSYGELVFAFIQETNVVQVLNVSNGKSPRIAGNIQNFNSAWPDCEIQEYKNLLFLSEGSGRLHAVDVSSPESVNQSGSFSLTGIPVCIGIKEDKIYIFENQCDICVLNIEDLSSREPESSSSVEEIESIPPVEEMESIPPVEKEESAVDKKTAYITIDDGPSRNNTPKNLDTLKKYGIKATFFVLPKGNMDDIYRRILEEGHVIGNHSTVHDYSYLFGSVSNFRNDVLKAQNFIYERFKYKSTVYRFPGGAMGRKKAVIEERSEILKELGYRYFDWDISTADTDPNLKKIGSEEQIVNKLANNVIKGANGRKKLIILMHDSAGKAYTANALPKIIEGLQKQGYVFDVLTNY